MTLPHVMEPREFRQSLKSSTWHETCIVIDLDDFQLIAERPIPVRIEQI
jgi:hypothetical protein